MDNCAFAGMKHFNDPTLMAQPLLIIFLRSLSDSYQITAQAVMITAFGLRIPAVQSLS